MKNKRKNTIVYILVAVSMISSSVLYNKNVDAATQVGSGYEYSGKIGQKGIDHYVANSVTLSTGDTFVVDAGYTTSVIHKISASGDILFDIEVPNVVDVVNWSPKDITKDSDDNIYVLNSYSNRVQKFDKNGNFIKELIFSHDGSNFYSSRFLAIDIDENNNMYITDDSYGKPKVQVYSSEGEFIRSFGANTGLSTNDNYIGRPSDINYYKGEVYVRDSYSSSTQSIKVFNAATGVFIRKITNSDIIGYYSNYNFFIKNDQIYILKGGKIKKYSLYLGHFKKL